MSTRITAPLILLTRFPVLCQFCPRLSSYSPSSPLLKTILLFLPCSISRTFYPFPFASQFLQMEVKMLQTVSSQPFSHTITFAIHVSPVFCHHHLLSQTPMICIFSLQQQGIWKDCSCRFYCIVMTKKALDQSAISGTKTSPCIL